jgi:hypothetical protein
MLRDSTLKWHHSRRRSAPAPYLKTDADLAAPCTSISLVQVHTHLSEIRFQSNAMPISTQSPVCLPAFNWVIGACHCRVVQ